MDAIHLMRAITGRDQIIKIEGSVPRPPRLGDGVAVAQPRPARPSRQARIALPSAGIPQAMADLVHLVPFNDLVALERVLQANHGSIAGMIMEPMMMNAGIIPPDAGLPRGRPRAHSQVRRAARLRRGQDGSQRRTPAVSPACRVSRPTSSASPRCSAAACRAAPSVASTEVMSAIVDGRYDQVGTFNGNPLTMAAARAMLTEVLTDDAYRTGGSLSQTMFDRSMASLRQHGVPAYGYAIGFKGSLVFNETPARNCRDFLAMDTGLSHLHFLVQHNGGVFMAAVGQERAVDDLAGAFRFRCRPLLRQRRALRGSGLGTRRASVTSNPPLLRLRGCRRGIAA